MNLAAKIGGPQVYLAHEKELSKKKPFFCGVVVL
jgi:hypothetical protein